MVIVIMVAMMVIVVLAMMHVNIKLDTGNSGCGEDAAAVAIGDGRAADNGGSNKVL